MSTHSAVGVCGQRILEAFKAIYIKRIERVYCKKEYAGKETNTEFGTTRRIFGVWPRSMGSALGDYLLHHVGGMLLR